MTALPPGFRLGLDATLADERTTGIGLVGRELGAALERQGMVVTRFGATRSGDFPRGRGSRTLWTLSGLPRALALDRPDVFHALGNFNLPLLHPGRPRLVLTLHDLIPLELPETVSTGFRWQFRLWLSRSLKIADRVVCVSEATRAALLRTFPVGEWKTSVVYNGVDHVERVPPPDATTRSWIEALGLKEHVVLYAGSLDARKNIELAVDACLALQRRKREVTLLVVGQKWFGSKAIEAHVGRAKDQKLDVRLLGFLADPVFYALMKRADAFVFPSRAEGFGLPPLEAMWLGTPTIVSTADALREVCGAGALHVDPDDAGGLADALEDVFGNRGGREALVARGRARARELTWDQAARGYADVYAAALE